MNARALHSLGTLAPVSEEVSGKLLRVMENYVFYLGKIFWPAKLSILYPTWKIGALAAMFCGLLLAVITLAAVWQVRVRPWLLIGWFWFLGTLVPVIGFVTFGHFYVGDRYTYIPSIGLTLAVVMTLENLSPRFETARWIGGGAVIALCALVTRADLPRWHDSITLYDAALRVGAHQVTYNNRGEAFLKSGDLPRALADFDSAIRLKPDDPTALSNRGGLWVDLGNPRAAIKDCTEAIKSDPEWAAAWNNRGNAYNHLGDQVKAVADYDQSIKLSPGTAIYYNNRAAAYFLLQQYPQASADLEKCRKLGAQPNPGLIRDLEEAIRRQLRTKNP